MLLNLTREVETNDEPIWQLLPVGTTKDQDWGRAVVWEGRIMYTLQREPALISMEVRHGTENFSWPQKSPLYQRWWHPRAVDLPRGTRLIGPSGVGDHLVMRSQGRSVGASSHIYSLNAENGSLAWAADMKLATAASAAGEGLPTDLEENVDTKIGDVLVMHPHVIVTAAVQNSKNSNSNKASGCTADGTGSLYPWGIVVELWLETGTVRWSSEALDPAPLLIVGSTELISIVTSAPDDEDAVLVYAFGRRDGALLWSVTCLTRCKVELLDTNTLLIQEGPSTLQSLRAVDMTTGATLWTLPPPPPPLVAPLGCGASVLTATDLVIACMCSSPPPPPPPAPPLLPLSPVPLNSSPQILLPPPPDVQQEILFVHNQEFDNAADDLYYDSSTSSPQATVLSVCVYSVQLSNGKLQWQTIIPEELLPPRALHFEQQPVVLPESVVVALRHSIVALRRDGSRGGSGFSLRSAAVPGANMTHPHQIVSSDEDTEGGEVLWQLPLPDGMVVDGWAKLEMHAGALLLRISADPDIASEMNRRMLLSLDPGNGEVLWNVSLGFSSSEPALQRSPVMEFTPGKILIDRCDYYPSRRPGKKGDLRGLGPDWKVIGSETSWADRMASLLNSIARRMRARVIAGGNWYNNQSPLYKRSEMGYSVAGTSHDDDEGRLLLQVEEMRDYERGDHSKEGTVLAGGRQREGDVECCLDAVDEVTGEVLWSHCYNHGQACRTGDARAAISFIMNVLLVIQVLAMGGGLGCVLGYRVLCTRPFNRGQRSSGPVQLLRRDSADLMQTA
ncbi:hypothetical protein CEUSTIGMA_g9728.t1 [Chlamydomonas eustigma]|uniref:Uncharacterized protein n=1 Tax=Chlamydomonas eustigma TaxID=1157962 RepID=A0A250XHA4_9CHLO|nr:hypothetical protein CEUSTIGMA_g9728.t1 [Chlamydomonas eustigma]|eukprot:GAX82299.1 hypothetical protein CEUSTIGMA_g9728.t1 [Chlamydomonas eustigma]